MIGKESESLTISLNSFSTQCKMIPKSYVSYLVCAFALMHKDKKLVAQFDSKKMAIFSSPKYSEWTVNQNYAYNHN